MGTESTVPNEAGAESPDTLRDALDAAYEQHATNEPEHAAEATEPASSGPSRDERGRFAARQEAASAPAESKPDEAEQQPNAAAPAVPGAPKPGEGTPDAPKAPGAWKPEAREKWGSTDPTIRTEVLRREREFQAHLQQASGNRQFVESFENVMRPYEMFIRAENSTPLQAVQNMMQTAAELRVGTPLSKARIVADIITNFGVSVDAVDHLLVGKQPPGAALGPQAFRDPRVDQLLAAQAQAAQQSQANLEAELTRECENFGATHEFFDDVRDQMADLIEIAARRGQVLTVPQAYEKACKLDDSVSKILAQRQAAANSQPLTQAALRAKRAAQSVKGDPSPRDGATVPENDSLRATIAAAFEANAQRI